MILFHYLDVIVLALVGLGVLLPTYVRQYRDHQGKSAAFFIGGVFLLSVLGGVATFFFPAPLVDFGIIFARVFLIISMSDLAIFMLEAIQQTRMMSSTFYQRIDDNARVSLERLEAGQRNVIAHLEQSIHAIPAVVLPLGSPDGTVIAVEDKNERTTTVTTTTTLEKGEPLV